MNLWALPLLLACTAKVHTDDTGTGETGDTADTGDSAESGDTEETGDTANDPPVILAVTRLECTGGATEAEQTWYTDLTVDDPQGADTVLDGEFRVYGDTKTKLAYYGLECHEGVCSAYFRAEYDHLTCDMAPTLSFSFRVRDEPGLWSEELSATVP